MKPDIKITEAKAADYDAIVFVGGGGAKEFWNDPVSHALARDFHAKGKPTSAICIAPVTLANAGLLKGKAATSWPDVVSKVKAQGAVMKSQGCVADLLVVERLVDEPATLAVDRDRALVDGEDAGAVLVGVRLGVVPVGALDVRRVHDAGAQLPGHQEAVPFAAGPTGP